MISMLKNDFNVYHSIIETKLVNHGYLITQMLKFVQILTPKSISLNFIEDNAINISEGNPLFFLLIFLKVNTNLKNHFKDIKSVFVLLDTRTNFIQLGWSMLLASIIIQGWLKTYKLLNDFFE